MDAVELPEGFPPALPKAETVQLKFIRGVLGLHGNGSGVSNEVLRAEVGAEPITSRWAKLKMGFWRRIFTAPPDRLLRVVAQGTDTAGRGTVQTRRYGVDEDGQRRLRTVWYGPVLD